MATWVFLILRRWNNRWIVSMTSCESMIALSTMASADSDSDPILASWKPRPLPEVLQLDDLDRAVADVQSRSDSCFVRTCESSQLKRAEADRIPSPRWCFNLGQ